MSPKIVFIRHGYTLVELLIVISIIAILAGIAYPVYMHVKANAKKTQCISNLRQLCQASLMYAQDYNGQLPPFQNILPPFGNREDIRDPKALHIALSPYVKNNTVFFCPTDPVAGKPVSKWLVYHEFSSYLFAFSNYPPLMDTGWNTPAGFCPPSRYELIFDANYNHVPAGDPSGREYGTGCDHFGRRNIVYLDGHIGNIR